MGKETLTTKSENDQDYIYDIVDSIYKRHYTSYIWKTEKMATNEVVKRRNI